MIPKPQIETAKAIITAEHAIIKKVKPYTITKIQLAKIKTPRSQYLALYYRFIRLAPFVSTRADVRKTYKEYVRFKFAQQQEQQQVQKEFEEITDRALNTLYFLQTSFSDNPEKSDHAEKIINNVLVNYFSKQRQAYSPKFRPRITRETTYGNDGLKKEDAFDKFLLIFNANHNIDL